MSKSIAAQISNLLSAIANCEASGNTEWKLKHGETLAGLCREYLPSGSGIDNGTMLDEYGSSPDKLVFSAGFHHMNDAGMYDGWTQHLIIVTPTFNGISVRITGRNRNDIKAYLTDIYSEALGRLV